jgi:Ser/Thr protein kinase RdoA (MazF antagonist)
MIHRAFPIAELAAVSEGFDLTGAFVHVEAHGNGHINDTFLHTRSVGASVRRFILQRINTKVFRDPDALTENMRRVTDHASQKLAARPPAGARYEILTLMRTRSGALLHRDETGGCWRCFLFVEGAESHDVLRRPEQAHAAAFAFGQFQDLVADLPQPRLHETIPHFHDTPRRFAALERAIAADTHGCARIVAAEIATIRARRETAERLLARHARGEIPERITHNDTKLNNVMLDRMTGHGVAVIDLDTVMPGLALYDFGDLVRTATNSASEDETDLTRIESRREVFAAVLDGYLAAARGFLLPAEIEELAFAGRLLTLENAVRFLTDFLQGDIYFKIARPGHNLDRCRAQLALLRSMEAQASEWEALVRRSA